MSRRRGDFREDLQLALGRAFERGVGPLAFEDVDEALANPLELLRAKPGHPSPAREHATAESSATTNSHGSSASHDVF